MLISSARRALQFLVDVKPARLIAYLNFAIFSCLAAISSLVVAFFLEVDSAKFRLEKNELQITSEDIFYDYEAANRQVFALEDAIFHFLQKWKISSDNNSSCKWRNTNLGNFFVMAGHQAWLDAIITHHTTAAEIIGSPTAITPKAVLKKYSEEVTRFFSGVGYSDSPLGIDLQRTLYNWAVLGGISTNSLDLALSEIRESEKKMRSRSQLAANIVVWLFVIQILGYLIITVVDARGSGKKNVKQN